MAYVNLIAYWELQTTGERLEGGSLTDPVQLSVGGTFEDIRRTIGTETTLDVWEAGTERLGDYDFLWISSDKDVWLELTTDKAADVGTVVDAKLIPAGKPMWFCTDDSFANYTADFAGGTVDVVDRIRIRNRSAADTANVRIVLIT